MAKQAHLQAILSAVDRISPVLRGVVGSAVRTRLGLTALNTVSFGGLTRKLGMLQKTARDVGSASRNVLGGLGLPATVGLGALGFGFLAAGRSALEYAGAVQDATDNTGMAIAAFQEYQLAFEAGGVAAEEYTGAVTKLNKGIGEAAVGKDKGLAGLMTKLRIPLRNAKGEIRSVEEMLPELADAFKKNENPAVRTRMAMELFGKSGAKLVAIMMQGGASLAQARKEAQRLGAVLSDESTGRLDDLGDAFGVLNRQVKVQTAEAFGVAAPAILAATKSLQEWIANNKGLLQQQIGGYITRVAGAFQAWVESGGFERLAAGIRNVVDGFSNFVRSVGGFRNVLLGIGALILAGPVAALVSLGAAVSRLVLVALPMLLKAIALIGRAFLLNPIGLVISAIALGGYLIYRNWSTVGPFFQGLWGRITNAATVAWNVLKFLFAWSPMGVVVNNWGAISGYMGALWPRIVTAAKVGWNALKFLFAWSPLGVMVNNWGAISGYMGELWQAVAGIVGGAWDTITGVVTGGLAQLGGLLMQWTPLALVREAWDPVVSFLTEVWEKITAIVGPMLRGITGAANTVGEFVSNKFDAKSTQSDQYGPRFDGPGGPGLALNVPTPLGQAGALQGPAARVQGDMRVRFENAPPGMRVDPGTTSAPGLGFNPDVGYRSMGSIG
jgi:hypothetical protein